MIWMIGLTLFIMGCTPSKQTIHYTPPPKACIKVWSKAQERVVYECLDTLDGPR